MKRIRLGNYCKITAGGDKPKVFSIIKNDECFVPVYSNGIENNGLVGYTNKATISEESVTVAARGSCGYAFFRDTPYVPIIRLISIIPFAAVNSVVTLNPVVPAFGSTPYINLQVEILPSAGTLIIWILLIPLTIISSILLT